MHELIEDLIGDDLHAPCVRSIASGVIGVPHAATNAIHTINQGFAVAMGLDP